jgi:hypothetical protein
MLPSKIIGNAKVIFRRTYFGGIGSDYYTSVATDFIRLRDSYK